MKQEPFKNKITMINRTRNVTFWGALFVFILAFVLFGCTTQGSSDPTITRALLTTASSTENFQLSLAQIRAEGVLRVGTAITEPFEYHDPDTGELIGTPYSRLFTTQSSLPTNAPEPGMPSSHSAHPAAGR